MKTPVVAISIVLLIANDIFSQAKFRKLPTSINHPSINLSAPFISADGNGLVFISDNAEDYQLTPFFSFRDPDWSVPREFPKAIYSRLNFLNGFALNADGSKLFYTTIKGPGVGGFDIWTSDWNGSSWSLPINIGMPINSKGHDGCPSVTPDGKTLYFMRCENMEHGQATNCKIFSATKKPNGMWDEPIELPAHINTGNSQAPRIMADAENLIFASDRIKPSKGGFDLFMTTFSNSEWSSPKPLDFVNTDADDQYVSATALGRYLLVGQMGDRKSELVEHLFPDHLRPKGMTKILGKVVDASGQPVASYISIEDLQTHTRFYHGRPEHDGSFTTYLREGTRYRMAVDPEQDHFTYYAREFDLTTDRIPQIERVNVTLKTLHEGDEIELDMFSFLPYTSEVEFTGSEAELRRLTRLVEGNPDLKFEIQVLLEGYVQDSIQSDPDLTEVMYDSTHVVYDDIDSLGQLYERDTILVDTIYHNDRTWRQSEAVLGYFTAHGFSADRFTVYAEATPAVIPGDRKLIIRAVARKQ